MGNNLGDLAGEISSTSFKRPLESQRRSFCVAVRAGGERRQLADCGQGQVFDYSGVCRGRGCLKFKVNQG